jgi:hypothetical protein
MGTCLPASSLLEALLISRMKPSKRGIKNGNDCKTGFAVFEILKKRQKCIMKAWRRRRHHSIILAIEEFESKRIKHAPVTERKRKAEGRKAEERESKKVKREAFVVTIDDDDDDE